jgi:hypothetical protein
VPPPSQPLEPRRGRFDPAASFTRAEDFDHAEPDHIQATPASKKSVRFNDYNYNRRISPRASRSPSKSPLRRSDLSPNKSSLKKSKSTPNIQRPSDRVQQEESLMRRLNFASFQHKEAEEFTKCLTEEMLLDREFESFR